MISHIARVAALTALTIGSAGLATACAASTGSETDATESSSALTSSGKTAYEYFVAKGLKNYQAAGIIGNLMQESSVNPDSVQSDGPGRGIAQWSDGGRWNADGGDNAVAFARSHGESVYALEAQLDFVWYELTTFSDYGLSELKSSDDVAAATIAFQDRFEGCGDCEEGNRIRYAQQVLSAYGGGSPTGSSGGSSYGSCTSTAGKSGTCIATSACAAKGGRSDSADLCPGPDDIQCCTTEETPPAGSSSGSCTNTAGKSGTCIATSACAAKGGSSDPADLCPGSADIQCCATQGSSGPSYGSCKSTAGKAGTCIATSACGDQGGRSDPADLCPGPDDIQCCTH